MHTYMETLFEKNPAYAPAPLYHYASFSATLKTTGNSPSKE